MTAKELMTRNARSENLRVLQTDDGNYFCESSEGKILYKVVVNDDGMSCTCGDWSRGVKKEPGFKCKHVLSLLNCNSVGEVEGAHYLDRKSPKLDERWIIELEGHKFVKYAGLLDYAHQLKISSIEVEPIQLPHADNGNFAICKATVTSMNGSVFSDIGDANPQNCNSKVVKHLCRIASTRSIARALRSFTNIGMTCLEELSDLNDIADGNNGNSKGKGIKQPEKRPSANPKAKDSEATAPTVASTEPNPGNGGNGAKSSKKPMEPKAPEPNPELTKTQSLSVPTMSEAQKRAIYNLSRRRGISVEDLGKMALEAYGLDLSHLSSKDASSFIRSLQQAA
jgi:hypothetical protein